MIQTEDEDGPDCVYRVDRSSSQDNNNSNLGSHNSPAEDVSMKTVSSSVAERSSCVNSSIESPLIISGRTSFGSLSSSELHSIRSSIPSEYSTRTDNIKTPSDIPDSPPKPIYDPTKSDNSILNKTITHSNLPLLQDSIHDFSTNQLEIESTSENDCLSPLTISDDCRSTGLPVKAICLASPKMKESPSQKATTALEETNDRPVRTCSASASIANETLKQSLYLPPIAENKFEEESLIEMSGSSEDDDRAILHDLINNTIYKYDANTSDSVDLSKGGGTDDLQTGSSCADFNKCFTCPTPVSTYTASQSPTVLSSSSEEESDETKDIMVIQEVIGAAIQKSGEHLLSSYTTAKKRQHRSKFKDVKNKSMLSREEAISENSSVSSAMINPNKKIRFNKSSCASRDGTFECSSCFPCSDTPATSGRAQKTHSKLLMEPKTFKAHAPIIKTTRTSELRAMLGKNRLNNVSNGNKWLHSLRKKA